MENIVFDDMIANMLSNKKLKIKDYFFELKN